MAVVQTGSLLSFSITSLVQLTRMGSLAGFLDNSKSFYWFGQLFFPKFQALHVCVAFLPQVPGLARARPPVPILDLGGYALW